MRQVQVTAILLSKVMLEKNIFTNYQLHSSFEFVWCLEPCAYQLYKEGKNIIPFPKEFMIRIQTRVGKRQVGVQVNGLAGRLWSYCTGKQIPVRKYFNLTSVFNTSAEQYSAELLCLTLGQSSPIPLQSA